MGANESGGGVKSQLLEMGFDGRCPALVAGRAVLKAVRHNFGGKSATRLEEHRQCKRKQQEPSFAG